MKYIIYKITLLNNPEYLYIGSTKNFINRKYFHYHFFNNDKKKIYNCKLYSTIRDNGGWDNVEMSPIEEFECENKTQALIKERFYYETLKANLNTVKPYITKDEKIQQKKEYREENKEHLKEKEKEWRETNKEIIKEKKKEYQQENKEKLNLISKEYRENHKEEIKEFKKKWYEENKERIKNERNVKIKCECGCEYTKANKARHFKTKSHLNLITTTIF